MQYTENFLTDVYRDLLSVRLFEEKQVEIYALGKVPGHIHSGIGEEATYAGVLATRKEGDYFKISREDLVSNSRKRQIVQARQISMYLCRKLIDGCSLAAIGAQTGGKDHSTVLHSCSIVSDLMSTDKVFKQYVTDIQGILAPVSK